MRIYCLVKDKIKKKEEKIRNNILIDGFFVLNDRTSQSKRSSDNVCLLVRVSSWELTIVI